MRRRAFHLGNAKNRFLRRESIGAKLTEIRRDLKVRILLIFLASASIRHVGDLGSRPTDLGGRRFDRLADPCL